MERFQQSMQPVWLDHKLIGLEFMQAIIKIGTKDLLPSHPKSLHLSVVAGLFRLKRKYLLYTVNLSILLPYLLLNIKMDNKMDKTSLTPEESLLLITKTIEETKERFKENGHVLVFWGALMLIVFGSQFILSLLELYKYTIYPVYLFPLVGGTYMVYIWIKEKKKNKPKTIIGNILGNIGWIIGMNLLILGFFFWGQLGEARVPVFLILLAIMIIVTGLSIKFKPFTIGGVLVNLIGLGTFILNGNYHGFSLMLGAVVGMIIPGILLNEARRKENV